MKRHLQHTVPGEFCHNEGFSFPLLATKLSATSGGTLSLHLQAASSSCDEIPSIRMHPRLNTHPVFSSISLYILLH
jgi:hypothetical protein